MSRNASEPDSASLCEVGAANLPYVMKPDTGGGSNGSEQPSGSPGWLGTAHGDRSVEEPGRPGGVAGKAAHALGECITLEAAPYGSRTGLQ